MNFYSHTLLTCKTDASELKQVAARITIKEILEKRVFILSIS